MKRFLNAGEYYTQIVVDYWLESTMRSCMNHHHCSSPDQPAMSSRLSEKCFRASTNACMSLVRTQELEETEVSIFYADYYKVIENKLQRNTSSKPMSKLHAEVNGFNQFHQ